ncbi:MAG TPA: c-type cytochrome [Bryobacteraceae bacterium]|jgi:putative heme-binding domain-containing protein
MIATILIAITLSQAAPDPLEGLSPAEGKRLFNGQCAVCHGIGGGGSTGPNLQRATLPRAATNADLVHVITEGIPNTQMPGAWQMTEHEARLVATYVRSLGKIDQVVIPGDPKNGEVVYAKSGCAGCHIISGAGRGFGPELTGIGLRRGAAHLRESIVDPAAEVAAEFMTVRLVPADGRPIKAIRVNEDSFTIQIKDSAGQFRSYDRTQLKSVEHLPKESLMPAYTHMKPSDLDDLVAYLASLR